MTSALESFPVIALSSLPGTNIITGFIKFFVYLSMESKLKKDLIDRASVDETGKKVNKVSQAILDKIDDDISNLKWFSLLQMIPLVGIIGVIFEQQVLPKINNALSPNNPKPPEPPHQENELPFVDNSNELTGEPVIKGRRATEGRKIIQLTDENFKEKIREGGGTVAVFFGMAKLKPSGEKFKSTYDKVAKAKGDKLTFAAADFEKAEELFRYGNIRATPAVVVFNNGREIDICRDTCDQSGLEDFIDKSIAKIIPSTK